MADTVESKITQDSGLVKPLNVWDPKVCHDPSPEIFPVIAKAFFRDNLEDEEDFIKLNDPYNSAYVDGILIPNIQINNKVLSNAELKYFKLSYDSFLPRLELEIAGNPDRENFGDTVRQNNQVIFSLVPHVDGVYKAIKMLFEIEEVKGSHYWCKFKMNHFTTDIIPPACITFPGCSSCKKNEDTPKISTWELFHQVAVLNKLGFAASKHCKDVSDRARRLINSESFADFLEEQIKMSGTDENTIMDAWLDLYGYLTLVNVSGMFNTKDNNDITPDNISIVAFKGIHSTSSKSLKMSPVLVKRVLTNFNMAGESNLLFTKYKNVSSFLDAVYNGTSIVHYSQTVKGTDFNQGAPDTFGKNNGSCLRSDIQTQENSIDGNALDDYSKQGRYVTSIYNPDISDYDINRQKEIHEKFFQTKRQNRVDVELKIPNYGLQRGTMVTLAVFEYDTDKKRKILDNLNNLSGNVSVKSDIPLFNQFMPAGLKAEDIEQKEMGILDVSMSDIYYIDGMEFIYESDRKGITQILHLIKRGPLVNYVNKYTLPKITSNKK